MALQANTREDARSTEQRVAVLLAPSTPRRRGRYERQFKRPLDIAVSAGLLVLCAPLMALIWGILRVVLGPPVVIAQQRVGWRAHDFSMLKFRTMRTSRRRTVTGFHGPDRRRNHKSDDDPRHTTIGRILRRTSLDELPQLLNVIRGEMSLVGPRPEMRDVVDRHGLRAHPRHTIRPGLTGLWQVTVRQEGAHIHETAHVDELYLEDLSFVNDLRILCRTIGVICGAKGR